jgi:hypothetical protein
MYQTQSWHREAMLKPMLGVEGSRKYFLRRAQEV